MLRKLSSWNDNLGAGNVIVWKENDLKEVSNRVVIVNFLGNGSDKLDDSLSVVITWSGFTTDHDDSWHKLVLSLVDWGVEDGQVSINNVENVHHLSLVLMDSLDLDIEQSVNWNIISSLLLDPVGKSLLILQLDLNELVDEGLVSGVWHKLLQVVKSGDPLVNTS